MPHRGVFGFLGGEWVTAEENAPACLETELKADYWYTPPKPPALVKPATTPCCRSPFLNQEEEIKGAPKLSNSSVPLHFGSRALRVAMFP